jgi:hypothetical protein
MNSLFNKPPAHLVDLMKKAGDSDPYVAWPNQRLLAKAISLPLEEALLAGDILGGLFQSVNLTNGESLDYPMDILNPGDEEDFIAYVCPDQGRIPERQVSADYMHLRTYRIANSIDMILRIIREANWDVLGRALQVMQAGFVQKMNIDGWRTLISSAESRGLEIYDSAASAGVFSRRLLSLMKIEFRRNGGSFTHVNRRKMTHLYLSPEGIEDIRLWGTSEIDDLTRRDLFLMSDGVMPSINGVRLLDLDEFGVGQSMNDYYVQVKGTAIGNSKVEIAVGADLTNPSFVMPIRESLMITNDPMLHRSQKAGFYGWFEGGFAALDNRDLLIGAF